MQALEDAFLAIDSHITSEEVIKELVQIAGRPQEEAAPEKVADEDDGEFFLITILNATLKLEPLLTVLYLLCF